LEGLTLRADEEGRVYGLESDDDALASVERGELLRAWHPDTGEGALALIEEDTEGLDSVLHAERGF
jgi:hypothetical protein